MFSWFRERRDGGGGVGSSKHLQFSVGRWHHVAMVDAGWRCHPRRATTRLLNQLPSFLRPSPSKPRNHQPAAPVGRSSTRSSSGFFPSSAFTASSKSAATVTTHSSYSNYSIYNCNYNYRKQHQEKAPEPPRPNVSTTTPRSHHAGSSTANTKTQQPGKKKTKQYKKSVEEDDDVGVPVEKDSYDPRTDFRESMLQMVVEMGLCGWDDLRFMLHRLLALNAPRHHADILAAFAEVCAQVTAPPQPAYQYHAYGDYHYHY